MVTSSLRWRLAIWWTLSAGPAVAALAAWAAGSPTVAAAAAVTVTLVASVVGWVWVVRPVTAAVDRVTATVAALVADGDPSDTTPAVELLAAAPWPDPLGPLPVLVDRLGRRLGDETAARSRLCLELSRRAGCDALTGLDNRQQALDALRSVLDRDDGRPVSVVLLDIDRFRLVNDTLGQAQADRLLVGLAQRLRSVVAGSVGAEVPEGQRLGDAGTAGDTVVARSGGDEFLLLLPGVDTAEVELMAERVLSALTEPVPVDDHQVVVWMGVGTATAPATGGITADRLLKRADHRLAVSRTETPVDGAVPDTGSSPLVARTDLCDDDRSRHEMIRDALTENRIEVWYQPIFSITGDERVVPTGAEALARVRDREGRIVHPADFLPGVERSDLGRKLDERVASIALDHLSQWQRTGVLDPGFRLSVNLSQVSASDVNFTTFLADQMRRFRIDPARVVVELPERAAEVDRSVVDRIRQLGVVVAIDDFGLNSSNLDRAEDFGAEIVKLDRRWVGPSDRPIDQREREILRALVNLCTTLDVAVVAEGIENIDQLLLLLDLGVSEIQGYFLSKPLTAGDFVTLVERYRSRASLNAAPVG